MSYFWESLKPSYWVQLKPFSGAWDKRLNDLMDSEMFTKCDQYTAELGGVEIWIANHPYSSFTPYQSTGLPEVRPRRRTIARAYDKLMNDLFQNNKKENK